MLATISPQEYVVVLDERGKDLTSDGLADLLAKVVVCFRQPLPVHVSTHRCTGGG